MDFSPRLSLPYLMPNQAQKHVTVNESLRRLDALLHLTVQSSQITDPPTAPVEGEAYLLLLSGLQGDWAMAQIGQIAVYQDAAWSMISPSEGWSCYDLAAAQSLRYLSGSWVPEPLAETATQLGINTEADSVNRFSVKSDAELLSHDDITPGTGDARKIINKSGTPATASAVFQSNWSGRAEIGLIGEDNLAFKTSPDGVTFQTCARFDAVTGAATFPAGQTHAGSGATLSQLLLTPGGDGTVSVFRMNVQRVANPRSMTLAAVSNDLLTLSTAQANEVFENSFMSGVSMVRIWNMSRTPIAPAWVVAAPDASSLQVRDAAEISGWSSGDTVQIGEPTTETPGRVIAIDISPMMQALFGTSFKQAGILAKVFTAAASSVEAGLDLSGDGQSGSFLGIRGYSGQASMQAQLTIPTTMPSPVSDSNLVFVRENDLGGGMGITVLSINALLV